MIPSPLTPFFRPQSTEQLAPPPADHQDSRSLFDIEQELLEQCTLGTSWPSVEDIRALGPERLLTLEDDQGRSLPHIILSHGPVNDERSSALLHLFECCPDLLKVSDPNGDTPLDIVFRIQSQEIKKFLDAAYPNRILNFSSIIMNCNYFKRISCICFSKQAIDIIRQKCSSFPVNLMIVNTLPIKDNPVTVCRELGKEDVMRMIYSRYPSSDKYGTDDQELSTLLTWGDLISIEEYLKNHILDASKLSGIIDRLFKIGYDKNLITKLINQVADLEFREYNCSFETKAFITMFKYIPEMIEKFPCDNELLFAAGQCLKVVDSKNKNASIEIFEKLIDKSLFDVKYLNEKIYIPHFISQIRQINPQLAYKIIIECAKHGFKESLFTDLCYGQLTLFSFEDFFAWIIPLFEKEEFPIQLLPSSKSPVLHIIAGDPLKYIDFFKLMKQFIPREQITKLLHLRNDNNCSPIDYLLSSPTLKEKDEKTKTAFLKELLGLTHNNAISEQRYRNFIFEALLYGDEEFDTLFPLTRIDHDSLVKPEEYDFKYGTPFFDDHSCKSIERERKFLEFMVTLPQKIQTFLLSDQMIRTSLNVPRFPFKPSSLLKNILESSDEAMLQNFVSLGGRFQYADIIYYFSKTSEEDCPKISPAILQKVLCHLTKGHYDSDGLFSEENEDKTILDRQRPNVIELILDQFFEGSFKVESTDLMKSFTEYTFKKLGSIYRDFAIFIQDDKLCIGNHEFDAAFEGLTTQKAIDRTIDRYLFSKTNVLQAYSHILFRDSLPNPPPSICILNLPNQQKFVVVCTNYCEGKQDFKDFPYTQVNVLEALLEFTKAKFQDQEAKVNELQKAFPNFKVELVQDGLTQFSKNNEKLNLYGIPSPEKAKSEIKGHNDSCLCTRSAKEQGFALYKFNINGNFSLDVKKYDFNKALLCFSISRTIVPLKLLVLKNQEKLSLMFCGGKDTLDSSIATIEAAHGYALNYQTAKNIKFPEPTTLIHDRKADIDLDRLNKLLLSYKGSDYLNEFLKLNNTTYDVLSSALKDFVSSCSQGKIKESDSMDSQKVIIQVSHTLKKLESTDKEELRRFVCELALETILCGWGISRKSSSEYKIAFNLLQQDDLLSERNLDSILTDWYSKSMLEAFETIIKFMRHPRSQGQSIHVESYLRSVLSPEISLPSNPLNGDMQDICHAGEDDIPREEVPKHTEAFFIPILIQKLVTKQKEDHEAYLLLLESFLELIPLPAGIFAEIEDQKNTRISDCEERLSRANDELNELLISADYTQKLAEYNAIKSKIQTLSTQWLSVDKNLQDIEENAARPHKKIKLSLLDQKGEFLLGKERLCHQKDKINVSIAKLNEEQVQLEELIGDSFFKVETLQHAIRKLKEEMDCILNLYRAQKKWKAEEFAESQDWLASNEIEIPYLTETGAAKLLELKNYIIPYGPQNHLDDTRT